MMSSVWIRLSLLYLLQHSVLSDEAVSLTCPKTVLVNSGETVEQNCSIEWKHQRVCKVENAFLSHSNDTTTCGNDSEPYSCAWDTDSTVTLKIVGVTEANITVEIHSSCGLASDVINVNINVSDTTEQPNPGPSTMRKDSLTYLISPILGVLAAVIVVAILSCLIRKYITSKHNQEHTKNSFGPTLVRWWLVH